MSEYVIDMGNSIYQSQSGLVCADVSQLKEEIVRCRDCKYGHKVIWPRRSETPPEYLDCSGPLTTGWDYYNDEPQDNPVKPDGFCAWAERRSE